MAKATLLEELRDPYVAKSGKTLRDICIAAADEIERLRTALEECAKASYLDEHDLEFRPTKEALIARTALG